MEDEGHVKVSCDFGALLRRHRLAAGLSQLSLAERAGMSIYGISALERGHRKTPQFETVALLAGALALNPDERRELVAAAQPHALRGRGSLTVGPWPSAGSGDLSLSLTRFIGRQAELDEIVTLLHEHRFVTLTGAGGVGKTQTALRAATALSDATSIAVCFVGLAPIGDPSLVATAVANALGVQEVPNHPLIETLVAFLKNKTTLLVLDNCEHVIGGATTVVDFLLHGCPNLRILATSREPLRAAGERTYRLPSLDENDAVALFADRAQAADAHFMLTDGNLPIVGEICRHLSGIPLAIELAAAQVILTPLSSLAKELEDRISILVGGERTAPPRQQTMRAAIDWSYDLLPVPEQRLFERLSVFAGGCTIDVAGAVCSDDKVLEGGILDLMSSLLGKSLVLADLEGIEPRYRLLEPFREYAREKLKLRGEDQMVARRHALAFLELAERFGAAQISLWANEILRSKIRAALSNCRAAVQWALMDGADIRLGQRLVGELVTLCGDRSNRGDANRWLTAALKAVDEQTPRSLLARLRHAEATFAGRLENHELQLARNKEAMALYREIGDSRGFMYAQGDAGMALANLGRITEASVMLKESLIAARQFGSHHDVGETLRQLAVTKFNPQCRDFPAARDYLAEAALLFEAAGEKDRLVWMKQELVDLALCSGDPELALRHATEFLAAAPNADVGMGNRLIIIALYYMSISLLALARYDEAEEYACEGLGLAREEQFESQTAKALYNIAAATAFRDEIRAGTAPGAYAKAARVLGFVDARLAALGSALDHRDVYRRLLVLLQNTIGGDRVAKLMAEGSALTEDQAVEEALAP